MKKVHFGEEEAIQMHSHVLDVFRFSLNTSCGSGIAGSPWYRTKLFLPVFLCIPCTNSDVTYIYHYGCSRLDTMYICKYILLLDPVQ
jgi:hypothetical protein